MSVDQAVILAAGRGSRMRRADDHARLSDDQARAANMGVKALVPVGRPFIDYVLSSLAGAGCARVCLVVAPEHEALRDHCRDLNGGRLRIEFAIQPQPLGTANALAAARMFAGDHDFVMVNSDNYYPQDALSRLREAAGPAVAAFTPQSLSRGNIHRDRLRNYAIIVRSADGTLARVLEKPEADVPLDGPVLVNMNCWRFSPAIFDACERITQSKRGEYELPDAVSYAIEELGERFSVVEVDEPVLDLSTRADVANVAERLKTVVVHI